MKVAYSPTFEFEPTWQTDIKKRFEFSNEVFEKTFGIHFSIVDYIKWEPEDETRETDLLMEELKSYVPLGPDEIVVGFHQMSRPFSKNVMVDSDTVGSAQFFNGYVILRDPFGKFNPNQKRAVLVHELGHLFGAVHVAEENAIMLASLAARPANMFDEENKEIINATKGVDFTKGLDSLSDDAVDTLIRVYERLIHKNPMSDFYYHLGKFYERRNQPAKAVATWESAVRYQYENPHIHHALGFHYFEAGRYRQAIRELGSAVAHFILPSQRQNRARTLNFLGAAYYETGNHEQAIFTWLKGLAVDPDNFEMQGNLASAFMVSGNMDRGVSELEKLVAKNPNDATTRSNLGVAYLRLGKSDEAIEHFERALQILRAQPSGSNDEDSKGVASKLMDEIPASVIQVNMGAAYLNLQNYEKAKDVLEQARQADPDNFEVHSNLAQAYLRMGQVDEAIDSIHAAMRFKKDDPNLYSFLGQAYSMQEKFDDALRAAKDGLKHARGKDAALFHKNIAFIYAQKGDFENSMASIKTALNQNWEDSQAHVHLGKLHMQKGDTQNALRSFQQARRMNPGDSEAKHYLDTLTSRQ